MRSKQFLGVLALAAIVGVVASALAWCFLELTHYMQVWTFTDLPDALGYDSTPLWFYPPVLAIAGILTALAIDRLPGTGGHIPAEGLVASPTQPIALPGMVLAGLASIGLGLVIGPEAPLIALGGGLGLLLVRMARKDAPQELGAVIGAAGAFAGLSFLFGSPIIAAVILIEATGLGGSKLPLVLIPGLFAAGIGSLVSIGMGSWTGLSLGSIALSPLSLPDFPKPDFVDFLWTIALAVAVAIIVFPIFRLAKQVVIVADRRRLLVLPVIGLVVAGLAIVFSELTDHGVSEVLFSGETALPELVANAGAWSGGALALLIVCKGLAYALSLGSFRGGPTFPAMFLGAAAGVMLAELTSFPLTPAVAVGIGAAVVAVLRLPLAAVVLATVLTLGSGAGSGPLVILGVVVAHLMTIFIEGRADDADSAPAQAASAHG